LGGCIYLNDLIISKNSSVVILQFSGGGLEKSQGHSRGSPAKCVANYLNVIPFPVSTSG